MAGHSKWANTKHRKAAQDYKKSQKFMKLIRNITRASEKYGTDPNINFSLRAAIEKATNNNITKETIQKAIQRIQKKIKTKKILKISKYAGYNNEGMVIIVYYTQKNDIIFKKKIEEIFFKYNFIFVNYLKIKYLFQKKIIFLFSNTPKNKKILINIMKKNSHDNILIKKENYIKIIVSRNYSKIFKKEFKNFSLKIFKTYIKKIAIKSQKFHDTLLIQFRNFLKILKKIKNIKEIVHNVKF
ncbi:YebC/PmpR family DNA-binding transcriptional regulator [Buchnera aphidicola]